MKKLVLLTVTIILIFSVAFAESINVSTMEYDDLVSLKKIVDAELAKREDDYEDVTLTSGKVVPIKSALVAAYDEILDYANDYGVLLAKESLGEKERKASQLCIQLLLITHDICGSGWEHGEDFGLAFYYDETKKAIELAVRGY